MRVFILMALFTFLALPVVTAAEKPERDPRFNGEYARLGQEPHDPEQCGCRTRFPAELEQSGGLHWVHNSGVIWRARAFPGSVRRVHGFHGRRGHGRRW